MKAFLDTNVIVRHLTADPPELGQRATAFLAKAEELLLADLIVAETVYVLESFYGRYSKWFTMTNRNVAEQERYRALLEF